MSHYAALVLAWAAASLVGCLYFPYRVLVFAFALVLAAFVQLGRAAMLAFHSVRLGVTRRVA